MISPKVYKRTKTILKWVLQSPHSNFYRQKYQGLKNKNFTELPFLTREEMTTQSFDKYLFVPPGQVGDWAVSSGTTSVGNPLMIPKIPQTDPALEMFAKLLDKHKINKLMVLARLTFLNDKVKEWYACPALRKGRPFIFGDTYNFNLAAKIASHLQIEGIETTPSILHFFTPFLKEVYDLNKIRFICLGGEYTSQEKLGFFRGYFPQAYFHFRFGGTENPIYKGYRCQYISSQSPRFFHPNKDFYLFEILDTGGKSVQDGDSGELVLTTLKKCGFPLIRYKTGDAAIWHHSKKCSCGAADLIEVLGRVGNDFIRISGLTLHTEMIEKSLSMVDPLLSGIYQLHVYEEVYNRQLLPRLVLNLFDPKISLAKQRRIKEKVQDTLYLSPTMNVKQLIKKGIIMPLEVIIGAEKEVSYKSIKIISHLK